MLGCMVDESDNKKPSPEIRKLYPNLTDEELLEAKKNLDAYLHLVLRMYDRICEDPEAYAKFEEVIAAEKEQNRE